MLHAKITFYVNGVDSGSFADPTPRPNSGQPFCIGGDPAGGWYFDGNVDEVAIYTNALTVAQLNLHYAVGLTNFYSGPIPAAITADPAPASAYADNGALYKVVVTNLYGSSTSAPAALTVMTDLMLVSSPASITRTVGSKAAFYAASGGALPVTYQWSKGTTAIPGATSQTLWLSNVQLADDATTYYAQIKNAWFTTNSEAATLTAAPRTVTVPLTGYAKVVAADDPVAFWRLDETEGEMAVDAVGSFNGTYTPGNGTLTYGVATGIPAETNKAISVKGGARVSIPWALELNPRGPFTAEAWFNPGSVRTDDLDYRTVFSSLGPGSGNSGPNGWLLYQQPNNLFAWVLFNEGWVSSFMGDGVDVIEANKWYHMALTYDGALFHIYVNGNLSATQAYDLFIPNQDGAINLGYRSDNGWNPFDGALDDVAFYNKALTLDQIQAHYQLAMKLSVTKSGNSVILTWPGNFQLQSKVNLESTWVDVPGVTQAPFVTDITQQRMFYRLR